MGRVGRPYWGSGLRPSLSTAFTVGKGCQAVGHKSRGPHPPGHKNNCCRMKTAAGLLSTSENPRLQWFRKDRTLFLCQVQSPKKAVQIFCHHQGLKKSDSMCLLDPDADLPPQGYLSGSNSC